MSNYARDQHIESWNVRIYYWSRSLPILAGIAAALLVISAGLGWCLQDRTPTEKMLHRNRRDTLETELKKEKPELNAVLEHLQMERYRSRVESSALEVADAIQTSKLPNEAKYVAAAYWDSVTKGMGEPNADLLYYAHYIRPLKMANELVGDLHRGQGDSAKARRYYEREANLFDSETARKKVVELMLIHRDWKALETLGSEPKYRALVPADVAVEVEAQERHWVKLISPLLRTQAELFSPMPLALAVVAGLVWMIIGLQAIQPPGFFSFRMIAPWFAVVMGMFSTLPTLFFVLYEEEVFGMRQTGEFMNDLYFFIAGVGVREELLKLLFFVPFIPYLLVRKSRLEMLMIAGFVGLGFAVAENLLYFHRAGPALAFGRFLTANFFHLAATGVIGLSLCEAVMDPLKKAWQFPCTLVAVMITHGCYDAFMSVRGIVGASMVSMVSFVLLSLYFFRQLRTLRHGATDQLSIAGTLIVGMSALGGAIFVCASSTLGFALAMAVMASSLVAFVMIAYMFYWQLGEGMSAAAVAEEAEAASRPVSYI